MTLAAVTLRFLTLCLGLLLFSNASQALEKEHTINHNGERHFRVFVPDHLVEKSSNPMVLSFHGGGGSIEGHRRTTKMDDAAVKHGYVLVYPAGTGRRKDRFLTWNAGICCGSAAENEIDDVGFISKLIDFMIEEYAVDATRVYATGHSNGAQISYRLACELSDRITAIAPNASQNIFPNCSPKRAVPVLHFHGTNDQCAKFDGGDCGGCFQRALQGYGLPVNEKTWACEPVMETLSKVAQRNKCSDETAITLQKGKTTCSTYKACAGDVEYCIVEGGGHTWPGGASAVKACERRPEGRLCKNWQNVVGPASDDISANDMTWAFFSRHRLPD